MPRPRQLRLGAFMRPVSIHTAAWRYPGAFPDANFNLPHLKRFVQTLERGRFDAFFMADHLAVLNMPMAALKRSHTVTSFEPFTLLSALAMVTDHIGLIATGSTTFDAPYHVARRFASLDHLSGGRAGWNIVTTSNPDAALNFGLEEQMEHAERYRRAREFYDVVTGLWDSWAEDAFVRNTETGEFFDPARMHVLDHKGPYYSVRGPLNIARPVQGWPVIVQAGASDDGRQLAAETAEVIFAGAGNLAGARALYADVKGRMARLGRDPDHRPGPSNVVDEWPVGKIVYGLLTALSQFAIGRRDDVRGRIKKVAADLAVFQQVDFAGMVIFEFAVRIDRPSGAKLGAAEGDDCGRIARTRR